MQKLAKACLMIVSILVCCPALFAAVPPLDFKGVTEQHIMIPMRDGVELSSYVYIPDGKGPWPVLMEQRYAGLTAKGTRMSFAEMASHGYVVCGVNFRGSQNRKAPGLAIGICNGGKSGTATTWSSGWLSNPGRTEKLALLVVRRQVMLKTIWRSRSRHIWFVSL